VSLRIVVARVVVCVLIGRPGHSGHDAAALDTATVAASACGAVEVTFMSPIFCF
jgi:hypothetical protein